MTVTFFRLSLLSIVTLSASAWAAKEQTNIDVPAIAIALPSVAAFSADPADTTPAKALVKMTEKKRGLASNSKTTGSEDLMSPELKEFRNKLLKQREAEGLQALLADYDAKYDTLPNDLKYVVARISPFQTLRGFLWRMAPLAHQAVVTQEVLLASVRAMSEQIMLLEQDTQWQAYMSFVTIPNASLVVPAADKGDGVKRKDKAFYVENDLADYLAAEVYPALTKAVTRLSQMTMSQTIGGKTTPIVFDNKIRFGERAFNEAYDAVDRFALVGEAERYAAMARFQRRMATIAQLAAYNWNGNVALRKELGRKYGVDSTISGGWFGGTLGIEGLTREDRIHFAKGYDKLFSLRSKEWMRLAYQNLHYYALFSSRAWKIIRAERDNYDMLLDPDLFAGRTDQIDKAMANLLAMLPADKDGAPAASIQGAITGEIVQVDLRGFFLNPPANLKELMPTQFNHHEDITGLEKVYGKENMHLENGKSTVTMKIGEQEVVWRNYLYGRATGWDVAPYSKLFPGVKSKDAVAKAQRTLMEARGSRPLMNTLAVFVK